MFGWLRKRKQTPRPEDTEAYKLGQRAADSMTADLDAFMRTRFDPSFDAFLGVLRDCFERTFDRPEAPPITLASIEYKSFLENVEELRTKMPPEISAALSGWRDLSDDMGIMRAGFQRLIDSRVESFMTNLTTAGLQMFTDMADRLKEADDRWRAANPEKADQFPRYE
jgi:hypothetical protein